MELAQVIGRARDVASDGVAQLTGRTAQLLDGAGETLVEASDVVAMTAARMTGETGEAAARACDWLAGTVSRWGEEVVDRVSR
jgi:hypothetical protein